MSEMLTRVADALEDRFKSRIAELAGVSFEQSKVMLPAKETWVMYAKAALLAMRDPTPDMIDAANSDWCFDDAFTRAIDKAIGA